MINTVNKPSLGKSSLSLRLPNLVPLLCVKVGYWLVFCCHSDVKVICWAHIAQQCGKWFSRKTLCTNVMCTVIISAFSVSSVTYSLKLRGSICPQPNSKLPFIFQLFVFLCPQKGNLVLLPRELHLFPIIVWDGYLFAKYKSGVLGDKVHKGSLLGVGS